MAAWTQIVWDTSLIMASEGTEKCHIEKNPLKIYCNGTKSIKDLGHYPEEEVKRWKRDYFGNMGSKFGIPDMLEFASEVIRIEEAPNGVFFTRVVEDLHFPAAAPAEEESLGKEVEPFLTLQLSKPFANFGQSLHVVDVDNDGLDDLLIGAPGLQDTGTRKQGCVFIIRNFEDFQPGQIIDAEEELEQICSPGFKDFERFGHSITSWDANSDSHVDLMVLLSNLSL